MVGGIQSSLSASSDIFAQMREKMFAKLDGDGDGQIDLAALSDELDASTEVDAGKARLLEDLKAADTDGDGMVSQDEFEAMQPPEPPAGGPGGGQAMSTDILAQLQEELFSQLDDDGDGQIDLTTLAEKLNSSSETDPGKARFLEDLKAADTDGDGMVSKEEFAAMRPPEPPAQMATGSAYGQDAELTLSNDISGSLLDLLG
jgi:Ca2+-binding EF-hand superfamily protein